MDSEKYYRRQHHSSSLTNEGEQRAMAPLRATVNHRRSIASPIFTELPLPNDNQALILTNNNGTVISKQHLDDDNTTADHSPFSESCFTLESNSEVSLINDFTVDSRKGRNEKPPSLVNILERIGQPSDLSSNNVIIHLRSTIANLLVEKDNLNDTIEDLSSKCKQLEIEKNAKKELSKPDNVRLQRELNETRLREADLQLALEELKSRIDLTDRIVQSEPQLLDFFNSIIHDKIPPKSRSIGIATEANANEKTNDDHPGFYRLETLVDKTKLQMDLPIDSKDNRIQKQGMESPHSDSGLSSSHSGPYSGEEWTISSQRPAKTSEKSNNYNDNKNKCNLFETNDDSEIYVMRRNKEPDYEKNLLLRTVKSNSMFEPSVGSFLDKSGPFVEGIDFEVNDPEPTIVSLNPTPTKLPNSFSKWKISLKDSLAWISKETINTNSIGKNVDFKFEALAAKHGEARALVRLKTTQLELRRLNAKCQKYEGHFSKQEEQIHKLEEDIDEHKSKERKLKHDIRILQRKIFQMEADHREYEVTQKIKEMELSSKLAEITFRMTHSETMNQQINAWNEIKSASMGESSTPVYHRDSESVPYVNGEQSALVGHSKPSNDQKFPPNTLQIKNMDPSPSDSFNHLKLDKELIDSILL